MRGVLQLFLLLLIPVMIASAADPLAVKDRQQLADGLFRRGLFELAAKEYATLSDIKDSRERDINLFRLGECYRRLGRKPEAEGAYKTLVENFPSSQSMPRAQLQRALLLIESGPSNYEQAVDALMKLTDKGISSEVRSAALYHLAEVLEKQNKGREALVWYEELHNSFGTTEYGIYSGLKIGWILSKSQDAAERRRAMGIYLDLAHRASDQKVAEEACFFAAQLALLDEKYEESSRLFQMLAERFPSSPRVVESALSAAWANYYCGKFKEAEGKLELIIKNTGHPAREEVLYLKANCLRQVEQQVEAVGFYDQQLKAFPDGKMSGAARYERIITLYRNGNYEAVLNSANQYEAVDPGVADNVLWMGVESAMHLKRSDAAVQNARLLVERHPESRFVKDALYRLGVLMQRQESWESAASWYHLVVERYTDDPLAEQSLYAAGVVLARLGQSEAALRDWTNLLTRYPESTLAAETLYQKAMEELRRNSNRAAATTLDELQRRFPADPRKAEVLYWRGTIMRQSGESEVAEKFFIESLASNPAKEIERETMLELGMLLQSTGRKAEAADYFQKLLNAPVAEKIGVDRLAWLAEFQCEQKQYDAAALAARTLIAQKPDKGWQQTAWTLLGRIHRAKSERDPAINAFKEALATGAATRYGAESALRLGELLSESGVYEEAASHLADAASRASTPELLGIRARAYMGMARNAEFKDDIESALRYYMSVNVLFDEPVIVPESLLRSAQLLEKLGRTAEAATMRRELLERYPDSKLLESGADQGDDKNKGGA